MTQLSDMTNGTWPYAMFYTSTNGKNLMLDESNKDHRILFNQLLELDRRIPEGFELYDTGSAEEYYEFRKETEKLIRRIMYRAKKIFGFYIGVNFADEYVDVCIRLSKIDEWIWGSDGNYKWFEFAAERDLFKPLV